MPVNHRYGIKVIDGYIKEALDLGGVQIHAKNAVGARLRDQIRDQFGGDGDASLILAVLPSVAVIGDDGGDSLGARATKRVDHRQEFHQVLVDGGEVG